MTNLCLSESLKINDMHLQQVYNYNHLGDEIVIVNDDQTNEFQRRIGLPSSLIFYALFSILVRGLAFVHS